MVQVSYHRHWCYSCCWYYHCCSLLLLIFKSRRHNSNNDNITKLATAANVRNNGNVIEKVSDERTYRVQPRSNESSK
ncbi:MAG TPA: hypothetical protein VE619_03315 [Nitrososphaeraceae archaeon]|nr:hypothetical protein [Nitrososphaeraceae archaeon]